MFNGIVALNYRHLQSDNSILLFCSFLSWDLMAVTMRQMVICWQRQMFWPMTVLPGEVYRFPCLPLVITTIACKEPLKLYGLHISWVITYLSFFFYFREKYAMMFDEPVLLQLGWWYVAWARVSGPSSDCGSHGQATITTDDGYN